MKGHRKRSVQDVGCGFVPPPHTLTKSVSMSAISPRDLDDLTCAAAGSQECSISEEDPAPLRSDLEVRGTKVSRTFSYLKSKMSKKSKEKDRDKNKDGKEKEKKSSNGHLFSSTLTPPPSPCLQCNRPISTKDALTCTMFMMSTLSRFMPHGRSLKLPRGGEEKDRDKNKDGKEKEKKSSNGHLFSSTLTPPPSPCLQCNRPISTKDALTCTNCNVHVHKGCRDGLPVCAKVKMKQQTVTDSAPPPGVLSRGKSASARERPWSTFLLPEDQAPLPVPPPRKNPTIMPFNSGSLSKSISITNIAGHSDDAPLKALKILSQSTDSLNKMGKVNESTESLTDEGTELMDGHLMAEFEADVKELEADSWSFTVDKKYLKQLKKDVIKRQDVIYGSNADKIKKVYGKFCSRHNEAVNVYKELHTRDKRFQAFIKKKMSSAVVRRLSIPECILLVTQRITKYPVLLQRLLQHTREPEEEQADVAEALRQMKEVLTGVDSKVNEYEKRRRLKEVYSRTDSKSIMRMKSGQMFAREDLIRGRKLLHDGPLQLKNAAGRLKDVQALLLSDVFVFLQEKDQKYVFASLDQRSTVISLQKLIVREVANEERGLFFITAGIEKPEMVEVHASSKDERNTWMQLIQNATTSIDKDDDEGIPSENEEDKRLQESKTKEMRDQLQKKDEQIVNLLEEKMRLFRELCDCTNQDEASLRNRMLFRATSDDVTKGEPIIKDALKEGETRNDRRREAREEQRASDGGFVIRRIGDVLLDQVTGSNADKIKKVYGKFCSRHNEAVNVYKELHTRDKRFQAFIKKKMSSAVVRRLSIPECILLVTQRITKYPVLLQRLLQHTREPEEEQADVAEALRQMKEVLTGVDSKVNEYEKRRRLKEVYSRTDSKSIMRMKSGQMFAREDLIRGRKLLHDGPLQLKNAAGRLKDVQALLLSDVFVFLQEKDQKYVFASLDQRSTVISLQKLIVREVANEERGLFFITAGIEKPEMVEVHASSKDERNTWMQLIQNATTSIDKDDDEGIPSENEEDKRLQESKTKEMRDQLQKKDEQIVNLLEEKMRLFRELCDCTNQDEASLRNRMLFRATSDDVTKGEPIIKDALKEVETLQELVNSSIVGQQVCVGQEDSSVCSGSVSLPRRAETFGGFDCHQMNISKNGDREEADDLRRTESDSVLKKGGTANLLLLHKRNSEEMKGD
ncbi:hypothetical protein PGIGA_G00239550 [Pangasianodon gigas]|uniref:Uncharacterized protein n=1 Tax=Pangasianodon gigas TaxID=30993 RepID=A0ACC5WNQ8_PANGG|nr:hypothetical protein [Pangasianodon gigas]